MLSEFKFEALSPEICDPLRQAGSMAATEANGADPLRDVFSGKDTQAKVNGDGDDDNNKIKYSI